MAGLAGLADLAGLAVWASLFVSLYLDPPVPRGYACLFPEASGIEKSINSIRNLGFSWGAGKSSDLLLLIYQIIRQ